MGFRSWLDDRTGYRRLMERLLREPVKGGASWAYVFGSALVFLFLLQAVTGVLLALYYSPSSREAWGSVYYIERVVTLGWFVRGLHHFGSSAVVILLVVHMLQVFLFGADRPPREISWWTGVLLLFVGLAFGLTGYLLPWDQKGFWATQVVTNIVGTFPWFGTWLQRTIQGGNDLGNLTLTRFFGFHVFFLPAALVILVVLHVYLFRRHGATPRWSRSEEELASKTEPFWPRQLTYDLLFGAGVVAVLVILTLALHGASLTAPADPSSSYLARPDWYFRWLFEMLKLVPGTWEGEFVLAFVVLTLLFLAALPLVDRAAGRSPRRRWPHFVVAGILSATIAGLTIESLLSDWLSPRVRAQEKAAERAAQRAFTLAEEGVPPGGAGKLYLNDPIARGEHVFTGRCQSCHKTSDGKGGDGGPDLRGYLSSSWVRGVIEDPKNERYYGPSTMMPATDAPEAQVDQLTRFVLSLGGRSSPPEDGRALYDQMGCHGCHALDGDEPRLGPTLADYGSEEWIAGAIRNPGARAYYGSRHRMPSFEGELTDEEIQAVVSFILHQASTERGNDDE